jgi:hypothetical protein
MSNFMKIRPVGAELFHAENKAKLIFVFRNFAIAHIYIFTYYEPQMQLKFNSLFWVGHCQSSV